MKKITVLIVDDHTIVRQGLRHLLQTAPDIEVVGEADNGLTAVRLAAELHPNVVLLDIAMPKKTGIQAARELRRESPESRVLMLSSYHEEQEVQSAMDAGAAGYMTKATASSELLNGVRQVANGNTFFSQKLLRRLEGQRQQDFQLRGRTSRKGRQLTPRELEVLKLIAEGRPNKAIGADLGISIKTVEKHRQALMDKLEVHETASVTRYAIARGIVLCDRRSLVECET